MMTIIRTGRVMARVVMAGFLAGWLGAPWAEAVQYTGGTLRDPFESLLPEPVEETPKPTVTGQTSTPITDLLNVQGTVWNSDRPQAVINGAIVSVGETVHGAEIVSITVQGVKIFYQGREYTIRPGKD